MMWKFISASGARQSCVIDLIGLLTGHNGPCGASQFGSERSGDDIIGFSRT